MKAAVIHTVGEPPRYDDFVAPTPRDDEVLVHVSAASITNIARMRAAGTHYSRREELPAVAGIDGVGRTEDGTRVYFGGPRAPYGTMAEVSLSPRAWIAPVPDALDDATAAALPNAGISAWLSLSHTAGLRSGESVLVLGATGVTGRLAVQAAKQQGAGRVVAAGRDTTSLARLTELGADATIKLDAPDIDLAAEFANAAEGGFDVVIDYLWGAPTEALIRSVSRGDLTPATSRTRLVQVGEMAGPAISLSAAALRSSGLEIVGNGTGSMPGPEVLRAAFTQVMASAARGELVIDTEAVPLSQVTDAWSRDAKGTRLVLVP
ncbi:zinc-binding alcohol dehydrogenase [Nocardiopsis gilva YIM 90087]|uniref:Zinc-binding alcohol dehydrogenase n=1 Tax=Nocardiopsis gilva YIM 90087 TaxID=1235441 RepID=A0A223S363_9ACTN|nr:zinc-binding alcohol dehydrogenase family protein [Nocardiopsis gilva]ASU82572.1 zinc-binding alcohol dehydrogenase [Nocardiopsis gilva YIM 90087]